MENFYLISVRESLKHKISKSNGDRRIFKISWESFAFIRKIE